MDLRSLHVSINRATPSSEDESGFSMRRCISACASSWATSTWNVEGFAIIAIWGANWIASTIVEKQPSENCGMVLWVRCCRTLIWESGKSSRANLRWRVPALPKPTMRIRLIKAELSQYFQTHFTTFFRMKLATRYLVFWNHSRNSMPPIHCVGHSIFWDSGFSHVGVDEIDRISQLIVLQQSSGPIAVFARVV